MSNDKVRKTPDSIELDRKLSAAGGGLLLIWLGIALLADVGWGAGLIGVGIILLAEQVIRRYFAVKFDGFWLVVGAVSVVSGVLMLLGVKLSLVPILLIVIGISLLASILKGRHKSQ